ncbi:MAG: hypothetical protein ACOX75_05710 [Lachnospiraceae bacterium]
MTESEKRRFIEFMSLQDELDRAARRGTRLLLNGQLTDSVHIASTCIFREDDCYMCDYHMDDKGVLREVNFNKVSNE